MDQQLLNAIADETQKDLNEAIKQARTYREPEQLCEDYDIPPENVAQTYLEMVDSALNMPHGDSTVCEHPVYLVMRRNVGAVLAGVERTLQQQQEKAA